MHLLFTEIRYEMNKPSKVENFFYNYARLNRNIICEDVLDTLTNKMY